MPSDASTFGDAVSKPLRGFVLAETNDEATDEAIDLAVRARLAIVRSAVAFQSGLRPKRAHVAELADALDSGSGE